jgi:hypothetical protein
MRARRLVELSQSYLSDPPSSDHLRLSRGYPLSTPVSHLPGCGPYALDSYRIFCGAPDEWKVVRPADKELIRYLVWDAQDSIHGILHSSFVISVGDGRASNERGGNLSVARFGS